MSGTCHAAPRRSVLAATLAFATIVQSGLAFSPLTPTHRFDSVARVIPAMAASSNNSCRQGMSLAGATAPEDRVVDAIREGVAEVAAARGLTKVTSSARGVWRFAGESGALLQSWLTPHRVEDCADFWSEGSKCLARDLSRKALRPQQWSLVELQSLLVFSFVAVNSFPWTPLLLPLIDRALEERAPVWPAAFGARRRSAFRRLRNAQLEVDFQDARSACCETPQNVGESARFLRDGGRIILRDVWRGRVWRESWALGRFAALALTTFPLTPLLLPLIDKYACHESSQTLSLDHSSRP